MTLSVRFKNTHDKFRNKFTYYNNRVQSIVGLKHHKWQIFNQTTNNNKLHDKITKKHSVNLINCYRNNNEECLISMISKGC